MPRKLDARTKLPGILVIHENRGLNEHIEDVARRVALGGYMAVAPDGLSVGGRRARRPGSRARPVREDRMGAHRGATCWPRCRGSRPNPLNNGKIGVGRLLLRRRPRAARRGRNRRRGRRGGVLRPAAHGRRHQAAPGAGAAATTRAPTSASMPAFRNSGRARCAWACPTASTCIRAREHGFQQRFERRALQRGGGQARVEPHHGFLRYVSETQEPMSEDQQGVA